MNKSADQAVATETIRSLAKFPDENPNPVLRISCGGELLYGNGPSAPFLEHWQVAIGGKVPAAVREQVQGACEQGCARVWEVVLAGRVHSISIAPIRATQYANLYCTDITERRAAENTVASLARFPNENPSPVLRLGADGTVRFHNTGAEKLLAHWRASEGTRPPPVVCQAAQAALVAGRTLHLEVDLGEVVYGLEMAPIVDGNYVNVYAHDITARKAAERELTDARDAALEASRAKSAFLANMSHELRTPMNAILGYSEIILEEADELGAGQVVPDVQKILSAGKHLLELINDILDLSKIEAGRVEIYPEETFLLSIVHEVRDTISPLVTVNQNSLVLDVPNEPLVLFTDVTKLRQILVNLLSNALKFTNKGTVTLRARIEGGVLNCWVTDTGIGMSEDQLARVWDSFTQADSSTTRKYGGTGLGLTISRRFSEMMNGTIDVASELGQGTTFHLRVPAALDSLPAEEAPKSKAEHSTSGHRILVVDDDPSVRDILQATLSKAGFQVTTASSGREGLKLARQLKPIAITLDVFMPEMDGWSVLADLKGDPQTRDIPVVVATISDDRNLGFSLGAADFMSKPFDRKRLVQLMNRFDGMSSARTLMVVEDDADARRLTSRLAQGIGWSVVEAENGAVALELLAKNKPDLILLDLMMPVMNGFGFIDALRDNPKWANIPIVVLTAQEMTNQELLQLQGSVERVLAKAATSREEILSSICQAVRRLAVPTKVIS